jgi:hypothetical protein
MTTKPRISTTPTHCPHCDQELPLLWLEKDTGQKECESCGLWFGWEMQVALSYVVVKVAGPGKRRK